MFRYAIGLGPREMTRLPLARATDEVDFSENSAGRTVGIYFGFIIIKWRTQRLQTSLYERRDEIQHLESDYDQKIRDSGHDAYNTVENVVMELLTIEKGTDRISRVKKDMMGKLDLVANQFGSLCHISEQFVWNLGSRAVMCMANGDNATRFVFELESDIRVLETECTGIYNARIEREKSLRLFRELEGDIRLGVFHACDTASKKRNRFLGFFHRKTRERLARGVEEAQQRLHNNLHQQRVACESIEALRSLERFYQDTWVRMGELRDQAHGVAGGFKDEFKRVTEVQEAKNKVFDNLLEVRNKICDAKFRETRDSSLRLVVELFRIDNDSWCGWGCLKLIEERITGAISARRLEAGEEMTAKLTPFVDASVF
ncbi:hypothetical protein ACQKWADRAFT_324846 [Trichoderma austrokoningii]